MKDILKKILGLIAPIYIRQKVLDEISIPLNIIFSNMSRGLLTIALENEQLWNLGYIQCELCGKRVKEKAKYFILKNSRSKIILRCNI